MHSTQENRYKRSNHNGAGDNYIRLHDLASSDNGNFANRLDRQVNNHMPGAREDRHRQSRYNGAGDNNVSLLVFTNTKSLIHLFTHKNNNVSLFVFTNTDSLIHLSPITTPPPEPSGSMYGVYIALWANTMEIQVGPGLPPRMELRVPRYNLGDRGSSHRILRPPHRSIILRSQKC